MNGKINILETALLGIMIPIMTSGIALASGTENYSLQPVAVQFDHSHADWDQILKRYIKVQGAASSVDYVTLKRNHASLDQYVDSLETVTAGEFAHLPQNERLAFLINAYNALTVKLVIDHYPVKSVKDIGGLLSSPWKIKFFRLFGEEHSLDDIEHEMIRKQFNEPRIHFALVCASKGCPALRNEAYQAEKLNSQLDDAANGFLKERARNYFDPTQSTLYLSNIFKWYGDDFVKKFGSVKAFVAPRIASSQAEKTKILSSDVKISFLNYDWSLNDSSSNTKEPPLNR